MNNKKVLGAKSNIYDGIEFKSILERSCYKKLKEAKLDFSYESEKIILWEGLKLSKVDFYSPKKIKAGKYGKDILLQKRKILDITYTPDFIVNKGKYKIYFDVKGKENDVYPLKKKMFLKYLENKNDKYTYLFFEPHNVRQMLQAIEIIKLL